MENKRMGVGEAVRGGSIGLKKIKMLFLNVFVGIILSIHVSILNDIGFIQYLDSLLIDPS